MYKCPLCNEIFPVPGALKCHFRTHGINNLKIQFSCSEQGCQFSSSDRQVFQNHLTSEHALSLVTCIFRSCKLAFSSQGEMERHWRNHMPFHCPLCQFVTANAKHLIEHRSEHELLLVPQGEKGKSTETMRTGRPESGRPKRTRKRTTYDVIQDEIEEESGRQQLLVKKAKEDIAKAIINAPIPSKDCVQEGTEHIYRTHVCSECRRCFKMRSHLLEHRRLHFPEPSLQCPVCEHYFTSKSKLHVHMLREAGQKAHSCHLCKYTTVERNALRRHLASVHADEAGGEVCSEAYPCPTCSRNFHQSSSLKAHMKTHLVRQDGQTVACFQEGCPFQSCDHKELRRHASDVHQVKAVDCRHHACNGLFRTAKDMEAHYRTHLPFHCSQCSYSCSNKSLFQHHKRQGHSGEEKLSCGFCSFITFNPVEFQQHVGRLHANEKVHRCPQCTFVTSHKRVLARHLFIHSGDKPHKCSLCDFRCRDVTYLSKHMLTHSDNKNHMCAECGYVTKWKHYLNVHMRKHAGDLRYKCDQCSYRCHRTDQLNSHKLRHQAKSLICEVCAYACKRKYELRKHMLLKHSNQQGHQLPILQCKYCPYSTGYRQALHNHENCKHTRVKEFCCALCPYSAYSSVSLFLHKRKSHGYVPGDKDWQESYEKREKESSSSDLLTQDFYRKPPSTHRPSEQPSRGAVQTPKADSSRLAGWTDRHGAKQKDGSAARAVGRGSSSDDRREEVVADSRPGRTPPVNSREPGCTRVSTSAPDPDGTKTTFSQRETESSTDPVCRRATRGGEGSDSVSETNTPVSREVGEEHVAMAEGVSKQSLLASSDVPLTSNGAEDAGKESEMSEGSVTAGLSERLSQNPGAEAELRLKAMRKQDGDQAEAMVREGRVQMLVVQSHDGVAVHRCCQDSVATRKQSSLEHRRKSVGQGRFEKLRCQACGAQFKRRPGLDTHLLKKCPALRERSRKSVQGATPNPTVGKDSVPCLKKPNGKNAGPHETLLTIERHGSTCRAARGVLDVDDESSEDSERGVEEEAEEECMAPKTAEVSDQRQNSSRTKAHSSEALKSGEAIPGSDSAPLEHDHGPHPTPSPVSCPRCDYRCGGQAFLEAHQRTSHPQSEGPTGQDSLSSGESRRPPPGTWGRAPHRCQLCPFSSGKRPALARHLRERHEDGAPGDKPLRCSSCEFTCRHQLVLEQHLRSHGGTRHYKCTDCDYLTPSRQKMTWHVRTHTGEKPYRCEQCGYACVDPSRLKYHMRIHQEERKYLCPECGYKCKWMSQLKCHMTKHTGDKPYACEDCDYRTNRCDALRTHRDTQHREFRPYMCEKCGKSFKTVFLLQTHQRKHSDERPYVCGFCQKGFRWPAGLRHHYLSHTNQQPFHCSQCPYRAKQKFQVVKHLRKHHPDTPVEQGVQRDPGAVRLTLREARLGMVVVESREEEEEEEEEEAHLGTVVVGPEEKEEQEEEAVGEEAHLGTVVVGTEEEEEEEEEAMGAEETQQDDATELYTNILVYLM
ncbi:zinc finger protein 142 [Aplochiton taeniatus]